MLYIEISKWPIFFIRPIVNHVMPRSLLTVIPESVFLFFGFFPPETEIRPIFNETNSNSNVKLNIQHDA